MIGELCSLRFEIECGDAERKKKYHQIWEAHSLLITVFLLVRASLTAEILHYCHYWIPLNTIECYWCFVECILFWQKTQQSDQILAKWPFECPNEAQGMYNLTSISLICMQFCSKLENLDFLFVTFQGNMQTKQKPKITSHSGESFTKCPTQPLGMSDSRSQFDNFYLVPFPPPPRTGPPVRACHRSCGLNLLVFWRSCGQSEFLTGFWYCFEFKINSNGRTAPSSASNTSSTSTF